MRHGKEGYKASSQAALEELSYHQHLENYSTDLRGKKNSFQAGVSSTTHNNGQITTSSGISGVSSNLFKSGDISATNHNVSVTSERN